MPLTAPLLFLDGRRNAVTHFLQPGTGFTAPAVVTVTDDFGTVGQRYTFKVNAVKVLSPTQLLVCVTCTPPTAARDQIAVTINVTAGGAAQSIPAVPAAVLNQEPIVDWTRYKKQPVVPVVGQRSVVFLPVVGDIQTVNSPVGSNAVGIWEVNSARQRRGRLRLRLRCIQAPPAVATGTVPTAASILVALLATLVADDSSTVETPPVEITYVPDPDEDPANP